MGYVKVNNGTIEQFPYTIGHLRRDNPNTSFPKQITDSTLESYGVYPVTYLDEPSYDPKTEKVEINSEPTLIDGAWKIGSTVVPKTAEEQTSYTSMIADNNRHHRDMYLNQTDWWALPDSPTMTAEQTAYRQALRDITTHANWPHLEESDWPTKP